MGIPAVDTGWLLVLHVHDALGSDMLLAAFGATRLHMAVARAMSEIQAAGTLRHFTVDRLVPLPLDDDTEQRSDALKLPHVCGSANQMHQVQLVAILDRLVVAFDHENLHGLKVVAFQLFFHNRNIQLVQPA